MPGNLLCASRHRPQKISRFAIVLALIWAPHGVSSDAAAGESTPSLRFSCSTSTDLRSCHSSSVAGSGCAAGAAGTSKVPSLCGPKVRSTARLIPVRAAANPSGRSSTARAFSAPLSSQTDHTGELVRLPSHFLQIQNGSPILTAAATICSATARSKKATLPSVSENMARSLYLPCTIFGWGYLMLSWTGVFGRNSTTSDLRLVPFALIESSRMSNETRTSRAVPSRCTCDSSLPPHFCSRHLCLDPRHNLASLVRTHPKVQVALARGSEEAATRFRLARYSLDQLVPLINAVVALVFDCDRHHSWLPHG